MARAERVALTLSEIGTDGPPVRLRDLIAITGLSHSTVRNEIIAGELHTIRRLHGRKPMYIIARDEARRWLIAMGFHVERIAQPSQS